MYEPPPGGFDLRTIFTEEEYKMEQICDEERYRSLYNNDAEELMYHEEEMKRLHQALGSENSYSQVGFNYDDEKKSGEDSQSSKLSDGSQDDEPFEPEPELEIPGDMIVPETQKLHAIIAKTAVFISRQGSQMEILIKAKQANNPQFSFLSTDGELHPYYKHVLEAIKNGKYNPEKEPEKDEPEPKEDEDSEEDSDEDDVPYLHPSLASSLKVEAAPSIPSINYKPSADCAYSMLVNKITGKPPMSKQQQQEQQQQQQPEVIPPPPMPPVGFYHQIQHGYPGFSMPPQQYSHGPVLYAANGNAVPPTPSPAVGAPAVPTPQEITSPPTTQKEPSPLVPYGPTPPKPLSRPSFIVPPADIQIIIDKMASYVAKNGRDFEAIVKGKGDPRFNFLELSHQYHGYYAHKLTMYEGAASPRVLTEEELLQKQELQDEKKKKLEELQKKQQRMEEVQKRVKMIQEKKKVEGNNTRQSPSKQVVTTVSFSIKKPKEGESGVIDKKNPLPVEESDEEASEEKKESNSKPNSPAPMPEEASPTDAIKEPKQSENNTATEGKTAKPSPTVGKSSSAPKPAPTKKSSQTVAKTTAAKPTTTAAGKPTPTTIKPAAIVTKPTPAAKTSAAARIPSLGRPPTTTRKPSPVVHFDGDFVDLTLDIFEDSQEEMRKKQAEEKVKDRILAAARAKLAANRERQLQLERRKKAAMFLSQIQSPAVTKKKTPVATPVIREELMTPTYPTPAAPVIDIEEIQMTTNSLMSRLRGGELSRRTRERSRSPSVGSGSYSEKQRSHKKHKKKKSSHKSSYRESTSSNSSRSHKTKRSKKSSRHRSRSRSPHKHHTSSRRRREESSDSSDSDSSAS